MHHRQLIAIAWVISLFLSIFGLSQTARAAEDSRPNLVFILADQWRAQATGYAGDPNAKTPNLDRLAQRGVRFTHAVSGCPVCSPYRGSLMTGRYPLTHGVFINDVPLNNEAVSLAQAFNRAGYQTGYIGKWHLDGHGRESFIPSERRQGFQFWRAAECSHDYNRSHFYGDDNLKKFWQGYDAFDQTQEAQRYLEQYKEQHKDRPFALILSLGPPHNPYQTAPERFKKMFRPENIVLRPNVPESAEKKARRDLAGYYAHIAALDQCIGDIEKTLKRLGLLDNTILIFTSDHGDMLGSHGGSCKQKPWDESILVPFIVHWPAGLGDSARKIVRPINAPDIMPTLLGLCGIDPPKTVEGTDRSKLILGHETDGDGTELITCPSPFGEWIRAIGGREYRGIRTSRYTYVRTLDGPWLLYDNIADPYQQNNLCDKPEYAELQKRLDLKLQEKLRQTNDKFLPGEEYIKKWGYKVDATGTMPFGP